MIIHRNDRFLLRFFLMGMCAILLPWAATAAAPASWQVTTVEGEATVQAGEALPVPLAPGRVLQPGERVTTGSSGRVVLTRGPSTITIGPNGRMEITAGGDDGLRTRVVQAMGSLLFKVEKRASQHFEVDTPYLAAVVKGTTFTVGVEDDTSAVHVVEGSVEVKALATGQVGLVKPGYTAVVSGRKGGGLSIIGGKPERAGTPGGQAEADEADGETDAATGAGGRAEAPGQVKRLHAMLGQASVDVAATSKGFVRNAGFANGRSGGTAVTERPGNGNGVAKGLSKEKSGAGKSAGSAGAAKASTGNPGGAKAASVAKASPAAGNAHAKADKAAGKLLAALAKAKEKALKNKLKVPGGGGGDDDDDDDDDD